MNRMIYSIIGISIYINVYIFFQIYIFFFNILLYGILSSLDNGELNYYFEIFYTMNYK